MLEKIPRFERMPSIKMLAVILTTVFLSGCKQSEDFKEVIQDREDAIITYVTDNPSTITEVKGWQNEWYVDGQGHFHMRQSSSDPKGYDKSYIASLAQNLDGHQVPLDLNVKENETSEDSVTQDIEGGEGPEPLPENIDTDTISHPESIKSADELTKDSLDAHIEELEAQLKAARQADSLQRAQEAREKYTNEVLGNDTIQVHGSEGLRAIDVFNNIVRDAVHEKGPQSEEIILTPNQMVVAPIEIPGAVLEVGFSNPGTTLGTENGRVEVSARSILGLPVGAGATISHKGTEFSIIIGNPNKTGFRIGIPDGKAQAPSIGVDNISIGKGKTLSGGIQSGKEGAGLYVGGDFHLELKNNKKVNLKPIIRYNGGTSPTIYFRMEF